MCLGLGSFTGLPESVHLLTLNDPGEETRTGYNGNKNISVWNNCNRKISISQLKTLLTILTIIDIRICFINWADFHRSNL